MSGSKWAVLAEENGKTFVVELIDSPQKVKGLGVFHAVELLKDVPLGGTVIIGQKELTVLPPRVPELSKGMLRRAQTIGSKDAGFFLARLGCGPGDVVLEAGIGSAGLSMYIARTLGDTGLHITVEPRSEHADVALENIRRAKESWPAFGKSFGKLFPIARFRKLMSTIFRKLVPNFPGRKTTRDGRKERTHTWTRSNERSYRSNNKQRTKEPTNEATWETIVSTDL